MGDIILCWVLLGLIPCIVYFVESERANVIIGLALLLFWPLCLAYITLRYALPWLACRIWQDSLKLLPKRKPKRRIERVESTSSVSTVCERDFSAEPPPAELWR